MKWLDNIKCGLKRLMYKGDVIATDQPCDNSYTTPMLQHSVDDEPSSIPETPFSDDTIGKADNDCYVCDTPSYEQNNTMPEINPISVYPIPHINEDNGSKEPVLVSDHDIIRAKDNSISDNGKKVGSFDKLLSTTVDTIKLYDRLETQVADAEMKKLLDDVCRKLVDNLILSGCKPIDESHAVFDMTRHKVVPFQIVPEGTVYSSIIRPGVEYNGEIILLAIVKL